eukprot:gene15167-16726_t
MSSSSASGDEEKEQQQQQDKSIMRPYEEHFGSSCKNPVHDSLSDVLLAINFNYPYYSNIPLLLHLYRHVFRHYVFCGPIKDPTNKYKIIEVAQPEAQWGYYGYQCLAYAIKQNPDYVGYLYINDDMIINWWTMLSLDKTKIWTGRKANPEQSAQLGIAAKTKWWQRANTARRCTEAFNEIESDNHDYKLMRQYFKNTKNERICVNGWSDIFYIPYEHSKGFAELSTIFYDHMVFLEAAVQTVLYFLDDVDNVILLNGVYLPDKFGYREHYADAGLAWQVYNRQLTFIHPYKFNFDNSTTNRDLFKEIVVDISDEVVKTSCLDIVAEDNEKEAKKRNTFRWSKLVDWSKE